MPAVPPEPNDYPARLNGRRGRLYEPLWRLDVSLKPVEQAVLTCRPLRRLHHLHHGGASFLNTHHTFSRLQHVLGVFALAAHLSPDDDLLRVAALLHDVGHAPFCHTLEGLEGVDHHQWTTELIQSAPIAPILAEHHFSPEAVLDCINGRPANILRNNDGFLHLDHLDSWVRSAQTGGFLPLSAPEILRRFYCKAGYIQTDRETAELLVKLIVAEAEFHCSADNLGPAVILRALVQQAIDAGALSAEQLLTLTDSAVEQILLSLPLTAEKADRLWSRANKITLSREDGQPRSANSFPATVSHLYLAAPLVNDQPITAVSATAAALIAGAARLKGNYRVSW